MGWIGASVVLSRGWWYGKHCALRTIQHNCALALYTNYKQATLNCVMSGCAPPIYMFPCRTYALCNMHVRRTYTSYSIMKQMKIIATTKARCLEITFKSYPCFVLIVLFFFVSPFRVCALNLCYVDDRLSCPQLVYLRRTYSFWWLHYVYIYRYCSPTSDQHKLFPSMYTIANTYPIKMFSLTLSLNQFHSRWYAHNLQFFFLYTAGHFTINTLSWLTWNRNLKKLKWVAHKRM